MDMDSSSVRDTPPSPEDGNSKEAIGAISRAYRDIFTSSNSNSNSQERAAKRANISTNNNNTSPFSQDAGFPQVSSHPTSTKVQYQSYKSCPVATLCPAVSNDNQLTFHNVDNNRYTYLVSTNQNHNQCNGTTPQSGSSSNHNSFRNAGSATNPTSCPWKLAPGAKVLVRAGSLLNFIKTHMFICCLSKSLWFFLCVFCFSKACPLNACPVSGAERTSQEIWESFSQCFTPAVKEVVEFAKGIPGFQELSQQDQVMLLKSGTFQVTIYIKWYITHIINMNEYVAPSLWLQMYYQYKCLKHNFVFYCFPCCFCV